MVRLVNLLAISMFAAIAGRRFVLTLLNENIWIMPQGAALMQGWQRRSIVNERHNPAAF